MGEARTAAGALGTALTLCFNPETKEHQFLGVFFHFSQMVKSGKKQQGSGFNPRPVAVFGDTVTGRCCNQTCFCYFGFAFCKTSDLVTLFLSTRLKIRSD